MKHIWIYVLIIIVLTAFSVLTAGVIAKAKAMKKGSEVLLAIGITLFFVTIYNIAYLQIYYHADEEAKTSLDGNERVEVSKIGADYLFDGPGEGRALVFIPGARVEETAYGPLLLRISEQGLDCFLVKVPSRMATFSLRAPDRIIKKYDYDRWYIAGHSLGGVVAAFYAEEHKDVVNGLVLLASYATEEIPDSIDMISIYGDHDACLSMTEYEECKDNWPSNCSETIIKGGNHSNFGNYGRQEGDGDATISAAEQQAETAEAIRKFFR